MTEAIRKSLRDSSLARWSALFIVAFTMLCGYFLTDIMAPLAGLLEGQLGWSRAEYGTFTSAYGWFNVFLLMLIFGGIILDKLGVRMTGLGAASVMVLGTAIKYWAVSTNSLDGQTLFGLNSQVFWASIGFAIFAIGVEVAGITVSKIIVKWFKGKELATAMGMEMAMARIGTALALGFSVPIAKATGVVDVSRPVLVALIGLCIGLISFIVYIMMDKKLDASEATGLVDEKNPEDEFKLSDIGKILGNSHFVCIVLFSRIPIFKVCYRSHGEQIWCGRRLGWFDSDVVAVW
jgi:hypothetical protein